MKYCEYVSFLYIQVEDLKAKLASQDAELTLKNENIEALIAKIGQQTERVSSKREAADVEAQKVTSPVTYCITHILWHCTLHTTLLNRCVESNLLWLLLCRLL